MRTIAVVGMVLALAAPAAAQEAARRPAGWIGVFLANATPAAEGEAADAAEAPAGVKVMRIVRDGPADRAGLRASDVVKRVDGAEIRSVADLVATIGKTEPGSWVALGIERRGSEREIRVRLDARPARVRGLETRDGWIGLEAIDLPASLREHFTGDRDTGVMVSEVAEASPAFVAGLELGDVVVAVDGDPVRSAGELAARIAGGGVGNPIELTVMRDGLELTLEARVADVPEAAQDAEGDASR